MKILIIKLGHSETLDPEVSNIPSLGDVMRSTVILHKFKNDNVTWLTDETAYRLLKNNPLIDRILFFDLATMFQLESESFDVIINLEKVPGLCAFTDKLSGNKYGFRFDALHGKAQPYLNSQDAFDIYCNDVSKKREAKLTWQDVLFEMIGEQWHGESYVLGYKPTSIRDVYDIGLNCQIGSKWPSKAWKKWKQLAESIPLHFNISWQPKTTNIEDYINWINSCALVVTHDSLGLHIALALKKKVVAIFGSSAAHETHLYGLGVAITPNVDDFPCAPCLKPECDNEINCMDTITVENVLGKIEGLL